MKVLSLGRIFAFAAVCILATSMFIAPSGAQKVRAHKLPKYKPPTVILTAQALYPINSIASGTVILDVSLDRSGAISGVTVLHGMPSLTRPAITAVKKWKFGPARLDGCRVPSNIPVAFTFVPPGTGPRL